MHKIIGKAPRIHLIPSILLLFSGILFFDSSRTLAAESVTGRYLQSSGQTIRLQLIVRNPAPQNLILQQRLPAGTRVLSTSPRTKNISSGKGVVKWLFKGVSPGRIEVVMHVQPPIPPGSISGSFRYRMPNGTLQEGRIGR